jgi:hypothetical protein
MRRWNNIARNNKYRQALTPRVNLRLLRLLRNRPMPHRLVHLRRQMLQRLPKRLQLTPPETIGQTIVGRDVMAVTMK